MTRLTNYMRDEIINKLIEHRFSEHEKELQKQGHILGLAIYDDIYPPEIQKAMAALPNNFLPLQFYICCNFGSKFAQVYFGCEKPVAYKHSYSSAKVYNFSDPLSDQFFKLRDERKELKDKKDIARETAQSILYSVHTVKKLLQVWPECQPFVETVASVPKPMLPALPIADVNAMLGLQPQGVAQA